MNNPSAYVRKQVRKLFLVIVPIIIITSFLYKEEVGWWRIKLDGEMYGDIVSDNRFIYVGDNAGSIRSVNKISGEQVWKLELEKEIFRLKVDGNTLYSVSGDSLIAINKNRGKPIWKFSTNSFYSIADFHIKYKKIIILDKIGNLTVISQPTGEVINQFPSKKLPESLSSIFLQPIGPRWGSIHLFEGANLIYSPPGGDITSLNLVENTINWTILGDDLVTSLALSGSKSEFWVGRRSGKLEHRSVKNGGVIAQENYHQPVHCAVVFSEIDPQFAELLNVSKHLFPGGNFLQKSLSANIDNGNIQLKNTGSEVVIIVLENGDVVGRGGQMRWKTSMGKSWGCPQQWYNTAFFRTDEGKIASINVRTGAEKWRTDISDQPIDFFSYYFSSSKWSTLAKITGINRINYPDILLSNSRGSWSVRSADGSVRWFTPLISRISSTEHAADEKAYYLTTINGSLNKISAQTGKYLKSPDSDISVSLENHQVGNISLIELTVTHDEEIYANPFTDFQIEAVFSNSKNGESKHVNGFYYDRNTWKVRFVPDSGGEWEYALQLSTPLGKLKNDYGGTLQVSKSVKSDYVRVNPDYPHWLTVDGKTIWNGVGMQDWPSDRNWNGSVFDDYSLGYIGGQQLVATTSSGLTLSPGIDENVSLDKYLDISSVNGSGMNLYRWNLNFPLHNLMNSNMLDLKVDLQNARETDHLFSVLKSNGYAVWATLFNFSFPFAWDTDTDASIGYIDPYIKYLVSRYGAFVDIWELTNEANMKDELYQPLISAFRRHDYQQKLITTSWEKPEIAEFDIIAPHWYESEPLSESDIYTDMEIEKFNKFSKPIIFGEQGNRISNYDDTSSDRLRIRLWTAFFNKALLAFWNTSHAYYQAPSMMYGNINIGNDERQYISIFRTVTGGISLEAETFDPILSNCGIIRSYGIKTEELQLVYFINPYNLLLSKTCSIHSSLNQSGTIEFIDPSTGNIIEQQAGTEGKNQYLIPQFYPDIVMKIKHTTAK
jgi:hypothetical protein